MISNHIKMCSLEYLVDNIQSKIILITRIILYIKNYFIFKKLYLYEIIQSHIHLQVLLS